MKTKLIGLLAISLSLRLCQAGPGHGHDEFVAHEWGTFTSVQGADGVQMHWNPFTKTDLPKFVYSRAFLSSQGGREIALKEALMSLVRMETPVIYFYSDQGRTADVTVEMPQGRITEWYPRANRVGPTFTTNKAEAKEAARSLIEWKGVTILPRDASEISADKLIREKNGNHYYEAREVDANFVRVASPHASGGAEHERDLFYRGVGFFHAPLKVELEHEQYLRLSTKSIEPMTDLFVLTIQDGRARYQRFERVNHDSEVRAKLDAEPWASLSEVRGKLMPEMASALVNQGLFPKEAHAMVNTWKDQWFEEEGTRVLYLLPRSWTDQTLPLTISPKPTSIVRVMVGRAEVITPATERELRQQVTLYSKDDAATKAQAVAHVQKLGVGRFLEPAMRKMLGATPAKEFSDAAWKLAAEASRSPKLNQAGVAETEPAVTTGKETAAVSAPRVAGKF